MNCYAAFAQAQQLENEGDADAALAAYTELVRAARAAHSSTLTYDETSGPGTGGEIIDSVPPTALVVSVALNSLGGLLLDARKLSDASAAFEDSLSVWGANGMALINLGDLEREHGGFETGFVHYQKAAELPPLEDADDADDADGQASHTEEGQGEEGEEVGEEEEEEEEGESDWFASFVVGPRVECVAQASYMCALMLHQLDRGSEAARYLRRFDIRHRLAPHVWALVNHNEIKADVDVEATDGTEAAGAPEATDAAAAAPSTAAAATKATKATKEARKARGSAAVADERASGKGASGEGACGGRAADGEGGVVVRWEGGVAPELLRRLKAAFTQDSPFWRETDYAERGYFSFWHDAAMPPRTVVDELAMALLPLTGHAERIVGFEWWVHTRAEARSIGHQMHFDTEEASLAAGRLVHPLVSSVTYLSGGGRSDPTVVFNQRVGDLGADHAHVSHPKADCVLMFPGDRLHCVCPSAPLAEPLAATTAAAPPAALPAAQSPAAGRNKRRKTGAAGGHGAAAQAASSASAASAGRATGASSGLANPSRHPQRVTLMIGFWAEDVASIVRREPLGACGPVPRPTRTCTWPRLLTAATAAPTAAAQAAGAATSARRVAVPRVEAPWEAVPPAAPDGSGGAVPAEEEDPWSGLEIPEARNHRFFLRSMAEFREQLLPSGGLEDDEN